MDSVSLVCRELPGGSAAGPEQAGTGPGRPVQRQRLPDSFSRCRGTTSSRSLTTEVCRAAARQSGAHQIGMGRLAVVHVANEIRAPLYPPLMNLTDYPFNIDRPAPLAGPHLQISLQLRKDPDEEGQKERPTPGKGGLACLPKHRCIPPVDQVLRHCRAAAKTMGPAPDCPLARVLSVKEVSLMVSL